MEPAESLDIIEVLVCRAAKLERFMEGSLVASSSQVFYPLLSVKSTLPVWTMLYFFVRHLAPINCCNLIVLDLQLPAAIFKLASFNLRGVTRQPLPQLVVGLCLLTF